MFSTKHITSLFFKVYSISSFVIIHLQNEIIFVFIGSKYRFSWGDSDGNLLDQMNNMLMLDGPIFYMKEKASYFNSSETFIYNQ